MAKLTGPLLSFGARGQIGKALVTSKWRGIDYARQYVIPANPRTTAQQNNRTRFALLREMWKLAPAIVQAPWVAFSTGRPFLPFNKFVGENNRLLVGQTDFANAIMSPGARGGLPPTTVVVATGSTPGAITVTVTPPAQLPEGWTVTEVAAAGFPQQNPIGLFDGPFVAATQANPATPIVLSGFTAGEDVAGFGWVVYERPDGQLAYSVSISGEAAADS